MNIYKDFVIVHNMRLDPRDVKLFVDWLKCCEKNSTAYLIGEAMQAAIDNYIDTFKIDVNNKYGIANYCDNLNYEGDYRITNALCTHCKEVKENDER